jgi:hypothetical protein
MVVLSTRRLCTTKTVTMPPHVMVMATMMKTQVSRRGPGSLWEPVVEDVATPLGVGVGVAVGDVWGMVLGLGLGLGFRDASEGGVVGGVVESIGATVGVAVRMFVGLWVREGVVGDNDTGTKVGAVVSEGVGACVVGIRVVGDPVGPRVGTLVGV